MQTRHRIRTTVISLTVILLLFSAAYITLLKMIDLDTFKEQILTELERTLKRPVSYKSGNLSFSLWPAISFHEITVKEPDNSRNFVTINDLTCRLELLPLLKKQLAIHGLVADRAVIHLERRSDGTFNISDLLESSPEKSPVKIHTLKLKNADITFTDLFLQKNAVISRFSETDFFLENLSRGKKGSFKLTTDLDGGESGTLSASGKIRFSPENAPIENSVIDAKISCRKLDSAHYWPYYRNHVPFKQVSGAIDLDTEIHGQLHEFTSSGKLSLHGFRLEYPPVFKQVISSKSIQIKYSMELNRADIAVQAVEANIDGATIKGSGAIKDYRSDDPRITAQAVASHLDYAKISQYIPYGVIVKDTADWIEQHLAGGIFQLDEGRLDGKVSQILHMETGENYNILSIKARVEKGVVRYGSSVPTFNTIKGTLEMKGKDFFLHGMSGYFGTSPLTLEGRITDYSLDKPSSYPFKMVISPTKNEVDWLLGKERSRHLAYNGNSSLTLSGEGFTSLYNLSGEWVLTPAAYSYSNYIAKPVGTPSRLKFNGTISPKEATLTALNYSLGGLNLDLSAKYPFEPPDPLEFTIDTNKFRIEQLAPVSPFLNRYQPSGQVQLSLRGTREPSAKDFSLRGTVALKSASIRYAESAKPVTDLTGSISFAEDSVESAQLTAKIGTTLLAGKSVISSLKPLALSASFTSPRIDLADFGFKTPQRTPQISKVKGDISFKENSLAIKALSGSLNSSQLSITGNVSDIKGMKADLAIKSTQLDIADLILLESIEKTGGTPAKPALNPTIKATVMADKGTFKGTDFKKLSATINLSDRVLLVQPLAADVFGGGLTAQVKIDSKTVPANYQVEFSLGKASADELINFVTANKREMTGAMTVEGNLTASGDIYDAIRKSAVGSITVHAEKGMLRQFPVLSKVFSVLNVSQLFRFKLPDMVSEGMPYNDLKATLAIKNGVVSTENLFLKSNAMNMSLVGKHDFVRDNMNLTIGIQPLQTVDKVVSSIPIVGWILTGKNKAMFSTYFEIKGKSTDPQVSAIPITSLGKGVLGIFKRAFQLPVKLFTDTGEVILGN